MKTTDEIDIVAELLRVHFERAIMPHVILHRDELHDTLDESKDQFNKDFYMSEMYHDSKKLINQTIQNLSDIYNIDTWMAGSLLGINIETDIFSIYDNAWTIR